MDTKFITYCVTVANEYEEIQKLLSFLLLNKKEKDNINVLWDTTNITIGLQNYLYDLSSDDYITLREDKFKGHFADWKNQFFTMPNLNEYMFFIDADELPHPILINNIHHILEKNDEVEILGLARINTVEGITQEHLTKWRWSIDDMKRINYPDYQYRICKSNGNVKWVGKVHETLVGSDKKIELPMNYDLDIHHPKTITKQESQNKLYDGL